MKFSEMPYQRPDVAALKEEMTALTERLKTAEDYASARAAFLEMDKRSRNVDTLVTLVSIRNSIDTRDKFYDEEMQFWNGAMPELEEYAQLWTEALLQSPFRPDFEAEFGKIIFTNAEISAKTFSPEIIAAAAGKRARESV